MAIAEMQKLNLVAMSYDRDKILNALQSTGATEVKYHSEADNTLPLAADGDALRDYYNRTETALELLCAEVGAYDKEHKIKSDVLKDDIPVTLDQFRNASRFKPQADDIVEKINRLIDGRRELTAEQSRVSRSLEAARIYACVKQPLSRYKSTRHAVIKLGAIPCAALVELEAAVKQYELCAIDVIYSDGENALIVFACHRTEKAAEQLLQTFAFTPCPFDGERSGEEIFQCFRERLTQIAAQLDDIQKELYALNGQIKQFKIYCDYLSFELEKLTLTEKMRRTAATFLLEAYVPTEAEEAVKAALDNAVEACYYQFTPPAEDELPPTLYRNNAVVKNFEAVTDMYSPANYREFDPNFIMSLFYSLFLGFIMADMGYGLLMILGGGIVYWKCGSKDGMIKRLSGVFAVGGIFAVIWGALFASSFGLNLYPAILPDAQNDMWSLMGIRIPAVLLISLEIGVVQIFAGYACRAVQSMRRGRIADGIFDGLVWAAFSVGAGLAIVGLIDEAGMPDLALIGGIIAAAMLAVAILTAGRKEKLLGKFTKGFGAAYGIINYASDILSYARLYGLMLSGAVIANIVSSYSVDFLLSGNVLLIILAVVLLLVGHGFNLAISLLGAYIHDARLQYVEFYGRFFEGDGELFAPLGSSGKYTRLSLNLQKF